MVLATITVVSPNPVKRRRGCIMMGIMVRIR
jgi:hypothetical protein